MEEIVPVDDLFTSKPTANSNDPLPQGDNKLLGMIIPAVMSAISIAVSAGTAAKNRKFQKEMQLQEQEYNTPANQMKRMKEAGLNPNLLTGQVSSGSFGQSPDPLPDLGQVVGNAGNSAFNGINALMQLKQTQLNMEMMNERVRQLRLSNEFAASSMPDRLRLLIANVLGANQVNDIRDFDVQFAKWFNGANYQVFHGADGNDALFLSAYNDYPLYQSPREVEALQGIKYGGIRNSKVSQDYENAIKQHDILGAQLYGYQLGNSRAEIALDYERGSNQPWGQTRPLDKFINYLLNGLMTKYGDDIMNLLYGFIDKHIKK